MTRIDPNLPYVRPAQGAAGKSPSAPGPTASVTLARSPESLARLTAGAIIEGVVVGRDAAGMTQVRTEHGMIAFRSPIALAPGSQLVLQIRATGSQVQVGILSIVAPPGSEEAIGPHAGAGSPAASAAGTAPAGAQAANLAHQAALDLAHRWTSLAEALTVLHNAAHPSATLLNAMIARPNPEIAATLLFFIAALGRGGVNGWLRRDIARALADVGRSDLAERWSADVAQLSRLAADADSLDWRAFLIPFSDGERLGQVRFFLKRHGAASHDADDEQRLTRFMFEVDLSRLGRIQLDGLAGEHRFDLMVRSLEPLPDHVQADIRVIFDAAREERELAGEIAFQTVPEFRLAPLEDILAPDSGVVV